VLNLKKIVLATTLSLAGVSAQAGLWDGFLETLPGATSPYPDAGFVGNQINGMHHIIETGSTSLLLPTYTNHPRWDYDNRNEENAYPFGAGISRSIIDERGNERLAYIMLFRDSHYEPEPILGYAWVARFPIANSGFHLGAGYTAGVTFREDYNWMPIPVPLPVVSMGTDWFNLYGTYIPGSNVFFFFSRIEIEDRMRRMNPLPAGNPWEANTEFYAQGSWVKTDLSSGDGDIGNLTMTSDAGYKFGVRYFLDRHWALDLSHQKSEHDIEAGGKVAEEFKLMNTNLLMQYHWEVADSVRLHTGAGVAYSKLESKTNDYEDESINPVVQGGLTWAITKNIRVNADMTVNFTKFRDVPSANGEAVIPANTSFNLGLGVAF